MALRKAKDSKAADNEFQSTNATAIQVWRSDGTEMPSEYSQYEKVEEGAKPIFEWQNKLGQALAAEVLPEATGLYFLQDFPSHYHLRWYQAKEEKKKNQAKHYYLFGYPEDGTNKARKYYRSPNQFLPHLLWLIGESQDRGDCACEFCSGSKPITSKSAKGKPTVSPGQPAPTTTPSAPPSSLSQNVNASSIVNPPAPMNKNTTTTPSVKQRPVNRPPTAPQQPTVVPHEAQTTTPYQAPEATSAIPQHPYTIAHDHDALFRAGEVVWFKNNNSWRVGMILTSSPVLSIIPFAHPLYQTQEVVKEEADIRPFLAFSIPQINNALQEFKGQALAQINWQALQERFGTHTDTTRREALAIEATKLAATRVDQCYSTFNLLESVPNYDVFGGIFLGAEKICVGEAVRIKLSREQQEQTSEKGMPIVMVVKRIFVSKEGGALMFEGSLWTLQHVALGQQPQTPNPAGLPAALRGEKEFRDSILQNRGWHVQWVPMNQNMTVNESAIRGRFYETRRLTPILNPAKFQEMLQQQHVGDIQTLLNNRADSNGPHVGRVLNRAQAVAGAVPTGVSPQLGPDVIEVY
ncbi:hypothetical protein F5B22DRAFT_588542 [Xylaria bambusicola]|uniref:uncharacterized protein n=1 Tax=Xylaria bambusicola TaxID=326684 RepID=UPI002007D171|nr:uncharacterized protein F5B22DRAFT_588542 [Xylaria bambusicola]KAI0525978.1 hypothetical protein F5B22DRAFT_588542 [Xylaria bambusicola]